MANLSRFPAVLGERDSVHVHDDFFWLVTAHQWTTLVADTTPTVAVGDAVNGVVTLFTDTTDNNEVCLRTTAELFKFGTNRSIYARGKIQYAENDTNKANVLFGFGSAMAANTLVDNGAGPRVTGDFLAIFKVDGGTAWKCISQTNGTAVTSTSTTTAGGSAAQVLEIECVESGLSTTMIATFKVDGIPLLDSTTGLPIKHAVVIASATEMNGGIYVKSGGGAGGETVLVDTIDFVQTRV